MSDNPKDWSKNANNNNTLGGINCAEGSTATANVDNLLRELMAALGTSDGDVDFGSAFRVLADKIGESTTNAGVEIDGVNLKDGNTSTAAIVDSNEQFLLGFKPSTTPVNFLDIASADTGDAVEIQAAGTDTNVSLNLVSKGSGTVQANGVPIEPVVLPDPDQVLYVRDEKTSGTNGGQATATTWNTRTLNTVELNEITGASLSSNQITLPAGTYNVRARAPGLLVGEHALRFYNITDVSTALDGASSYTGSGLDAQGEAHLQGRLVLASEKVLRLDHYTTFAGGTTAFGRPTNIAGRNEIYAEVWITKINS